MAMTPVNVEEAPVSWTRRWRHGRNRYDLAELAGAFGDLGTLIPFVVGYITVMKIDALGILFMFGTTAILVGWYFKTPMPVQPMKAIGGAVIAAGGAISPGVVCGAGLFTGLFWLVAGVTGTVKVATSLAAKPVVRGILLGLGLSFMTQGILMMRTTPWLAAVGLGLTYVLLTHPKIPAMFALLLVGTAATLWMEPSLKEYLVSLRPAFRLPHLALAGMTWQQFLEGTVVLALPQIPLTLGNAVIAVREENNLLYPDRPVTERMLAVSQGLMNLAAAPLGGIPMCHGAGGMAGHVRFGARTGGSLVMLGFILIVLALFFSGSAGILFGAFPKAVLGVILFVAGGELAVTVRDIGTKKDDVYVMLVVAAFSMWNMGVAFLAGILLHQALQRRWVRL
jgi:MFS superfamily sulfate permease-like transporter